MASALAALLDASITLSFVLFVLKASALVATRKQHADVPDDARKRKNLTAQVMDHVRGALVVLGVSTDEGNGVNAEPSLVARVGRYETRVHHFPGSVKAYASPAQLARWRAEPVNVQTSQHISATQDRREFKDEQHATTANAHVAEEQPREDDVTDEPSHAPAPAPAPVAQKPKQPETQRPPRVPPESQEKMPRLHFPGPVPQGALQAAEAARRATRRRRQRQCDEGAIRGPLGEFLIADDDEGDRTDESDTKVIAKSAAIASADTSNTSVSSLAPSLRSLIQ
ncbi:hypothetical protein PPROV_000945800 [Pycnococcus provasolii]|uniref:Uncharacterized protein n=1 Tax=Pycnococcus provasolii TaxID=41880 RepID=A0A830I0Q3_9CHLO|nr:hypothetical protein PPROV_000945800 [Pycnococcus provasolii]